MPRYFAQINFTIETDTEAQAELTQAEAMKVISRWRDVVDASADEPVEVDEQ